MTLRQLSILKDLIDSKKYSVSETLCLGISGKTRQDFNKYFKELESIENIIEDNINNKIKQDEKNGNTI